MTTKEEKMQQFLNLLLKTPLFDSMNPQQLTAALDMLCARKQQYKKGSLVLHTGEPVKDIGIVLQGCLQILQEDYQGNVTLVAQLEPGELFAEAFACGGAISTVTVMAAQLSAVCWLDFDRVLSAGIEKEPVGAILMRNLVRLLAKKNVFLTGRISHMSKRTLREKVLSYLSEQAVKSGKNSFQIPLNRQQMADFLAVDRSALSAVLCKLRDEGVIRFHKNEFTLL